MTFEQIALVIEIVVLSFVTYKVFVGSKFQQLTLHDRFLTLGDQVGKSLDEIILATGPPKKGERLDTGVTTYSWSSKNYFIILRFEKKHSVSTCSNLFSEEGSQ